MSSDPTEACNANYVDQQVTSEPITLTSEYFMFSLINI